MTSILNVTATKIMTIFIRVIMTMNWLWILSWLIFREYKKNMKKKTQKKTTKNWIKEKNV